MILSCPACETTFVVADTVFGTNPRRVRCSKCRHEWVAMPPVLPEALPTTTEPPASIQPIPKGSNLPVAKKPAGWWANWWQQHGGKVGALAGGLLCLYLLSFILAGAGLKLPTLFAHDPMTQLVLEEVKTRYDVQDTGGVTGNQLTLVVEGMVRNTGNTLLAVPPIIIETKDKNGKVLATARANLQTQKLPPGQSGSFVQSFDNPGDDLADITVAFQPQADQAEPHEH